MINNVVSGQVNEAGAPAAISLHVTGGAGDFTVVNNTVAYNDNGLALSGRPDLGAQVTAVIANNIVAFNDNAGLRISDFTADTASEHNLLFGNPVDPEEPEPAPGPGTVLADPLFAAPDDLRPLPGSPARNAGSNARVPGDVSTDVLGGPRIVGASVDIGAYELPEPRGAAAAAAATGALAALRRRRPRTPH